MDQTSISNINKRAILQSLFKGGNKSRADLAKELRISKPAVADNVASLLELGVISETGEGQSSKAGGRRPILLEFNKNYRYIVSIDLSLEEPLCAVGNLKSELLGVNKIRVSKRPSKGECREAVMEAVLSMLGQWSLDKEKVGGIVISSPGIVKEDGEYYYTNPQHEKWTKIGLKEYLSSQCEIPVLIKNDVNLAVLAEMEIGTGKEFDNILYISCGLGLGSGIVLNRKIYEGRNFAAGEIGYFIQEENLVNGKNLENEIKLSTILDIIRKDLINGKETLISKFISNVEDLEFKHVVLAHGQGDPYTRDVLYGIGKKLGVAVSNIASLLDLDIVIFGGAYAECSETLLQAVNDVMSQNRLFHPVTTTSELKENGSIYGSFVIGSDYVIQCASHHNVREVNEC